MFGGMQACILTPSVIQQLPAQLLALLPAEPCEILAVMRSSSAQPAVADLLAFHELQSAASRPSEVSQVSSGLLTSNACNAIGTSASIAAHIAAAAAADASPGNPGISASASDTQQSAHEQTLEHCSCLSLDSIMTSSQLADNQQDGRPEMQNHWPQMEPAESQADESHVHQFTQQAAGSDEINCLRDSRAAHAESSPGTATAAERDELVTGWIHQIRAAHHLSQPSAKAACNTEIWGQANLPAAHQQLQSCRPSSAVGSNADALAASKQACGAAAGFLPDQEHSQTSADDSLPAAQDAIDEALASPDQQQISGQVLRCCKGKNTTARQPEDPQASCCFTPSPNVPTNNCMSPIPMTEDVCHVPCCPVSSVGSQTSSDSNTAAARSHHRDTSQFPPSCLSLVSADSQASTAWHASAQTKDQPRSLDSSAQSGPGMSETQEQGGSGTMPQPCGQHDGLPEACSQADGTGKQGSRASDARQAPCEPQHPGQTPRGVFCSLLIPCKQALNSCFPLNGTYFQTNEVFLVDATVHTPLLVSYLPIIALQRSWKSQSIS